MKASGLKMNLVVKKRGEHWWFVVQKDWDADTTCHYLSTAVQHPIQGQNQGPMSIKDGENIRLYRQQNLAKAIVLWVCISPFCDLKFFQGRYYNTDIIWLGLRSPHLKY